MAELQPLYALSVDLPPEISNELRADFYAMQRELQEGIRHAYQVLNQGDSTPAAPRRVAHVRLRGASDRTQTLAETIRRDAELQLQGLLYSTDLPDRAGSLAVRRTAAEPGQEPLHQALEQLRRQTEAEIVRLRLRALRN